MTDTSKWNAEVQTGKRFEFGKNWTSFLKTLTEERITIAKNSLLNALGVKNLNGLTFLDMGCGSGLFSLAAYQLGATVTSIDFDPDSVSCARFLRSTYAQDDPTWTIEQGSVLDPELVNKKGKFDVVYSWGVLHHTGQMWQALGHIAQYVKNDGKLFISIYNDQGKPSKRWLKVKQLYNKSTGLIKLLMLAWYIVRFTAIGTIKEIILFRPFKEWRDYKKNRGMSRIQNIKDWIGGLPFEVAKPEEILFFFKNKGFDIDYMQTCAGGIGCNEFVFTLK